MIGAGRRCERFSRLTSESLDRDLSAREEEFLAVHRTECDACRRTEQTSSLALNMLRGEAFSDELEISPHFDERVLRRVRLNQVREGLAYWSPAAWGAGIACIALFAALHVAATPVQRQKAEIPGGQARNSGRRTLPNLELKNIPEFRR